MTLDFSCRSSELEIIDDMALDPRAMDGVLADLQVINRWLGGYATTIDALRRLVPDTVDPIRILDVGAGGGDMARALLAWGRKHGRRVIVVSVDLSPSAVAFARSALEDCPDASVVLADVHALPFASGSFDVAHCSLFLHHFPDAQASRVLSAMYGVSRYGVIVNDLHRHPLAYAGIWLLTRLLRASPTVRSDGPLSVLRAFRRRDLESLARSSGLPIEVRWRWAFRWQALIRREEAARV